MSKPSVSPKLSSPTYLLDIHHLTKNALVEAHTTGASVIIITALEAAVGNLGVLQSTTEYLKRLEAQNKARGEVLESLRLSSRETWLKLEDQ